MHQPYKLIPQNLNIVQPSQVQADKTTRTYPPLFMINLPKEEEILEDLKEILAMEYLVQVIMVIVSIAVAIIILYFCCTKCRHTHFCFYQYHISYIQCITQIYLSK